MQQGDYQPSPPAIGFVRHRRSRARRRARADGSRRRRTSSITDPNRTGPSVPFTTTAPNAGPTPTTAPAVTPVAQPVTPATTTPATEPPVASTPDTAPEPVLSNPPAVLIVRQEPEPSSTSAPTTSPTTSPVAPPTTVPRQPSRPGRPRRSRRTRTPPVPPTTTPSKHHSGGRPSGHGPGKKGCPPPRHTEPAPKHTPGPTSRGRSSGASDRSKVERCPDHHDQMLGTRVEVRRPGVDLGDVDADRALDLTRLAVEPWRTSRRAPGSSWRSSRADRRCSTPSAYSATSRSVTFSPLPPMRIGEAAHAAAGSRRLKRSMMIGRSRCEVAQARRRGAELVAVLVVVALEPARADAEHEPAAADVVDRARHVGEQVRVAVRVAGDERAELRVPGVGGHRREQRVRLEVRGVRVAVERVEVVPDPDAVDLERVGGLPRRPQLLDASSPGDGAERRP